MLICWHHLCFRTNASRSLLLLNLLNKLLDFLWFVFLHDQKRLRTRIRGRYILETEGFVYYDLWSRFGLVFLLGWHYTAAPFCSCVDDEKPNVFWNQLGRCSVQSQTGIFSVFNFNHLTATLAFINYKLNPTFTSHSTTFRFTEICLLNWSQSIFNKI